MIIDIEFFYGVYYDDSWYITKSKKEQGDIYFELMGEKTDEILTYPSYPFVGSVVATTLDYNVKIISSKIVATKIDSNVRGYPDIIKQIRLDKLDKLENK